MNFAFKLNASAYSIYILSKSVSWKLRSNEWLHLQLCGSIYASSVGGSGPNKSTTTTSKPCLLLAVCNKTAGFKLVASQLTILCSWYNRLSAAHINCKRVNRFSTLSKSFKCSSQLPEQLITSSKLASIQISGIPDMKRLISRWKVAGAFFNPNGILLNRNVPKGLIKHVLSRSSSATSAW